MANVGYNLLHEVWRKAALSPVRIDCGDEKAAHKLRFALYNSVKRFKRPGLMGEADDALRAGIESCSVTFATENPAVVVIGASGLGELEATILQALGEPVVDKRAPIERKAEESLKRLEGLLPEGKEQPRTTPYFTRDV